MPRPPKAIAMQRLQRAFDGIPALTRIRRWQPDFEKWQRDTRVAIGQTFGDSSSHVVEFDAVRYSPVVAFSGMPDSEYQDSYVGGLESAAALLESMIDEIEEYWENDDQVQDSLEATNTSERTNTNQVFLIHGRDQGTRETVARFLENLGLEPVILQEQPDQGRTIIEKFEQYAQANFAVALFTPDDVGGLAEDSLQPRVRQNVVFEFGYFIGKFGRDRVCALVEGDPEIPPDYSGVLYIPLDESGAWKFQLVREMKSAGFDIDANLAF